MKIALAGARVRNSDIAFNFAQMIDCMEKAREQGAELVCFGEAFLQGFDAFSWQYEKDREIALSVQDDMFLQLLETSERMAIDVLFGFLEREDETLYSSCALIGGGRIHHLYRRVSVGWKEYTMTDHHYCEGSSAKVFDYRGRKCLVALCGDLWDTTALLFKQGQEITFWPLYISFSREEWYGEENERQQYADKAGEIGGHVLLINSVDDQLDGEYPALGGCCHYQNGEIKAEWPLGDEGMLLLEL